MKKSNMAILIISCAITLLYITYAFSASDKMTSTYSTNTSWVEAEGTHICDTINVTYSHLVCEFPVTTLDARYSDQIVVSGTENGKIYASAKVINDTLYLKHNYMYEADLLVYRDNGWYSSQHKYSALADGKVNGKYPLQIKVGSKNLKSITVKGQGKISIHDNPIARKNDEPIYDPEVHQIHFHKFDKLDIHLIESGRINLFMHVKTLNLVSERLTGSFQFQGKINKLNFLIPYGYVQNPTPLNVDSAFIYSPIKKLNYSAGVLKLNCSKFLYAELNHDMDIYYRGNPKIEKSETSYGRVVNDNSRPDIENIINTRQREAHKIPTAEEQIEIDKRVQLDSLKKASYRDSIKTLRLDPSELIQ